MNEEVKSKLVYVDEYIAKNSCDDLVVAYFVDILNYIYKLETKFSKQRNLYKEVQADIIELQQESKQLKELLTNNSKINIADHKYASECEDKIIELENQLKQRDGVIDELEEFLKAFHNYENRFKWCEQDYIDTIEKFEEILQKYKGAKNNE